MFLDVTLNKRAPDVVEEKVAKPLYDWCYENNINTGKQQLDINAQEFKYEMWRTNSSLSNFRDTILTVNEMNINYNVTDQMHYDYLFHMIKKTKRYGKKKTDADKKAEKLQKEEQEKLHLVQEYYKYNIVNAKSALRILTQEQLDLIRKKQEKGGAK